MARRRKAEATVQVGGRDGGPAADDATGDVLDEDLGAGLVVRGRKAGRSAAKAEKYMARAAKLDRKASTAEEKLARAESEDVPEPLTDKTVKRYLAIARVVVPVLTPVIYQAAGTARAKWDEYRAHRLGVAPDEASDFTGRGAVLYARIHNLSLSIRELRERSASDPGRADEVRSFADGAETRLADLEAALRAAEQMPADRRRRAHRAAANELDRLESTVLDRWGLRPGAPSAER